jgi:hypothetical protein
VEFPSHYGPLDGIEHYRRSIAPEIDAGFDETDFTRTLGTQRNDQKAGEAGENVQHGHGLRRESDRSTVSITHQFLADGLKNS